MPVFLLSTPRSFTSPPIRKSTISSSSRLRAYFSSRADHILKTREEDARRSVSSWGSSERLGSQKEDDELDAGAGVASLRRLDGEGPSTRCVVDLRR